MKRSASAVTWTPADLRQELGDIVHLIVDDDPAVLLRVVLGDLVEGVQFASHADHRKRP